MNKETRVRTALRIVVSIYSGLCVWQVAINELGEMIGTKWLAIICAVLIVLFGLLVDVLTTYFNNDYTEEGCKGTAVTRQMKAEQKDDYIGERFFTENPKGGDEDESNDL